MEQDEPSISPELAEGEILETYAIEALLGRTDACLEYRARDRATGQLFRIKEYFPAPIAIRAGRVAMAANDSTAGEFDYGLHRFVQIGQACTRLSHENLLRCMRVLERNGTAYQVIEMPQGIALEEWLGGVGGKVDQETVDTIARQLCDVIGYLHGAEQLHLNICPGTIFIEPVSLKITLLEHYAAIRGFSPREAHYWHGYLSPESVSDKRRRLETAASDIYSAGAILLRLASGEPPPTVSDRASADAIQTILASLEGPFRLTFLRAVGHALALPANERPSSIREWRASLIPPTARRSKATTRFKSTDLPATPQVVAIPVASSAWAISLTMASALMFTLVGLAIVSEFQSPTRPQSGARYIIALRPDAPPTAVPLAKPGPVAISVPKTETETPGPNGTRLKDPATVPPLVQRSIPYPPPKPEIALRAPVPETPSPSLVVPKPVLEKVPVKPAEPPLPGPEIVLPLPEPIPLPVILRRTTIGPEDTVMRVRSLGKPMGEATFNGPWLALASQSGAPNIQLYKFESGGFTGLPPPTVLAPPIQVVRLTLDPRSAAEILVAAPDGRLSAFDRASGRWQGLPHEPSVAKRVISMAFDTTQEAFAVVSVVRKEVGATATYSTIAEWFSGGKKKGAARTLLPDGNLAQAAGILGKQFALAVRGQGLVVLDGDGDRRLLDHRSRETLNVVEFSPGGSYLAAGGEPSHVYLWEQSNNTFSEPKKFSIPDDGEQPGRDPPVVRAISFSADQKLIAVGLSSGTIVVWNTREPKAAVLTYLPSNPADVLAWLGFIKSGEGRYLLLFPSFDGSARSFAVDSHALP